MPYVLITSLYIYIGLDLPFGTGKENLWPYRQAGGNNFASDTMKCPVNDYKPVDRPMHEIIDELASDNEFFAEKFLESWHLMTTNGYRNIPRQNLIR